ncbi:hypothetical protein PMIN03_003616 [Paraphaeosphaeria minitans]
MMASVITRSRPPWSSSVCEMCLSHVTASRRPAPGSLRFLSVTTRTARPVDSKRASYQRPASHTNLSRAPGRLQRYNSTQIAPPASGHLFLARAPPPAPSAAGCARLSHRRLIALSGPDTPKFLQGLVTNSVDPSREVPFYAAFLDARGRMLWDVFIWSYPGLKEQMGMAGGDWACLVEVDAGEVDALAKHLKRHKLRSKIVIKIVEETSDSEDGKEGVQVWASWGEDASLSESHQSLATIPDPRFIGDKIAMRRSLVRPLDTTSPTESAPLEEYHRLRHTYGIPEGQAEIPREAALPMEYNVDLAQGIDFKKGCYLGQELTIRTKHTGVVRKRILPVELSTADAPHREPDTHSQIPTYAGDVWKLDPARFDSADIKQVGEDGGIKKGRAVGKLVSVCGNVGLALCRLEMMTSMKVSAEGGTWMPGMEFAVADREGRVVNVRPFLQDEWVTRVRDIWDKKRTRI